MIHRQGAWMVQGAGVDGQPGRRPSPHFTDRPMQQPRADTAADEIRDQSEIGEIGAGRQVTKIELREARRYAVHIGHIDLDGRVVNDAGEFVIREALAIDPVPWAPNNLNLPHGQMLDPET